MSRDLDASMLKVNSLLLGANLLHYPWKLTLATLLLFMAFYGGHYVSGDNMYRIAWTKSLMYKGSNDIHNTFAAKDLKVGTTCKYSVGPTLLHMPFLFASDVVKRFTHLSCEGPVNMLVYVLNGVIGVLLIRAVAVRAGLSNDSASVRAFLIGATSMWFPFTKVEYCESLVATCLLGAWLSGAKHPMLAGFLAGLSGIFRNDGFLWGAITIFSLRPNLRAYAFTLLGASPSIAVFVWSNYVRYGSVMPAGYVGERFDYPVLLGIYGLLFSFGKSVFLFNPLSTGLFFGWRDLEHENCRDLKRWALVLLIAQVIFFGAWWDWSGDDSWGPRFLVPSALVLQACGILWSGWKRWSLSAAVTVGLVVNLPAVLIGPHTSLMMQHIYKPTKQLIFMNGTAPISIDDTRFVPRYSQVIASWELLIYRLTGKSLDSSNPVNTGSSWLQGFVAPPLVPIDIFWLNLSQYRPRNKSASQAPISGQIQQMHWQARN